MAFIERESEALSTRKASIREVLKLAWPIIISMSSMSVLGLVDVYFMKSISTTAQSAVGVGAPTVFSILSLFLGLISGLTTFVSQYFGAKRFSDCGLMLWQVLILAFVLGVLSALILPSLVWELLIVMGTNEAILQPTFDYLQMRLWAAPWVFSGYALLSFLRGIGDMKTPAIVSFITVAANIPLTYIFAFGWGPIPQYGVTGAAIGTILSQFIEMLCYAFVVFGKTNALRFHTRKFIPPSLKSYKLIGKVALPVGISWAIEHYGWIIFGLYIASLPAEQSAANATVQVFMNLVFMPGLAISIAATTLVGQYKGANNLKSAEKSANYCILLSIGCLVALGALIVAFRGLIAEGFSEDPAVIEIIKNLFLFGLVYQIFDATGITTSGALRGAGDTTFPMIIGFVCVWALLVPLTFVFGKYLDWGVYGAWIACCVSIIASGSIYYIRFKRGKWKVLKID